MTEETPQFELTPPPAGLLTLDQAARTVGVSRQAFHRWQVRPVRTQGTEKLFDLACILENRLAAATESDRSPEDAEIDRLRARCDLLTEQLEHQRLKNQAQRQRYAPGPVGEWVLRHSMDQAARCLEGIPAAVLEVTDKTDGAESLLIEETRKAGAVLRAAAIEPASDSGSPEVYT